MDIETKFKNMKPTSELIMVAGTGTNLIIDASTIPTSEIIMIVGSVGRKGGHITITNCIKKPTSELLMICRVYPTNITLDFTDN
jgi:hypothetical protein